MQLLAKRLSPLKPGRGKTHPGQIDCVSISAAPSLMRFIADDKWKAAQSALHREAERRSRFASCETMPGLTKSDLRRALRAACRRCPPKQFILSLMDLCTDAATERDALTDRYPLQIALEFAASMKVIEYLAALYPDAASATDGSGKTALHILCESYVVSFRERSRCSEKLFEKKQALQYDDKPIGECMLSIVKYLRQVVPTYINLEDKNGVTAIEYAVLNCVDKQTVSVMHSWSQRDWKNRALPGYGQAGAQKELWDFTDIDKDKLWGESPRLATDPRRSTISVD